MTDPRVVRDQYRTKAYVITILLTVIALFVAIFSNWQAGQTLISMIEIIVVVIFLLTIPVALKQKRLELLSNFVTGLLGLVLVFNTTQIGSTDPSPFAGLVALMIISALLTVNKYSFLFYTLITYVTFAVASLMGLVGLTTGMNIKFQIVYIVIALLLIMHKDYLDMQHHKLFELAQKTHEEAVDAKQSIEKSSAELEAHQEEAAKLQQQAEMLHKQKHELSRLNELMTGREVKMVQLKKRIKQLEQELSEK
jgi:uncharacterized membrane protein